MTLTAWVVLIAVLLVALAVPDLAERAHRRQHAKDCERCNP